MNNMHIKDMAHNAAIDLAKQKEEHIKNQLKQAGWDVEAYSPQYLARKCVMVIPREQPQPVTYTNNNDTIYITVKDKFRVEVSQPKWYDKLWMFIRKFI